LLTKRTTDKALPSRRRRGHLLGCGDLVPQNLAALADLPGQWIDTVHRRRSPRIVVLDMDSTESPTYGEQEGSAYNGHFGCTCYHPRFVFNQLGDLERCALRPRQCALGRRMHDPAASQQGLARKDWEQWIKEVAISCGRSRCPRRRSHGR
jgi:hypothetical protein